MHLFFCQNGGVNIEEMKVLFIPRNTTGKSKNIIDACNHFLQESCY